MAFSGSGAGTSGDPYQITSWAQLNEIRDSLASYYILINNLDDNSTGYFTYASSSANSGAGWSPIATFTGSFNGQGNTISDLYINRSTVNSALFGVVDGGSISNIVLENVSITSSNSQSAGLVAQAIGALDVSNCYVSGDISGPDFVGGLIGLITDETSSVVNCHSSCIISGDSYLGGLIGYANGIVTGCSSSGSVFGDSFSIGGLAGLIYGVEISNCYSTCSVSGDDDIGGFAGETGAGALIFDCYSTGEVIENQTYRDGFGVGGFVGENNGTVDKCFSIGLVDAGTTDQVGGFSGDQLGAITNSFWDTQTSGKATSNGGTGKTTAEMKDIDTFTDTATTGLDEAWDMVGSSYVDETWFIIDGSTYPHLGYEVVNVTSTQNAQVMTVSLPEISIVSNNNLTLNTQSISTSGFSANVYIINPPDFPAKWASNQLRTTPWASDSIIKTAWTADETLIKTSWQSGVAVTGNIMNYLVKANSTTVTAGSTTVLANGYDPSVEQLKNGQSYLQKTSFN